MRCGLALAHGWQIFKRPVDPVFVRQGQGIDSAQGCLSLSSGELGFCSAISQVHSSLSQQESGKGCTGEGTHKDTTGASSGGRHGRRQH